METNRAFLWNFAETGCHFWFRSSVVSTTACLPISWPRTRGGKMAAPDPTSHLHSRQDQREKDKAAIPVPSQKPSHEDPCFCLIEL